MIVSSDLSARMQVSQRLKGLPFAPSVAMQETPRESLNDHLCFSSQQEDVDDLDDKLYRKSSSCLEAVFELLKIDHFSVACHSERSGASFRPKGLVEPFGRPIISEMVQTPNPRHWHRAAQMQHLYPRLDAKRLSIIASTQKARITNRQIGKLTFEQWCIM